MNDSMRRGAAILLVILGGAALWPAGSGAPASASANDAMVATITAAREQAAANDPGLEPATRFEKGGRNYVQPRGDPGAVGHHHGYPVSPEIEEGVAAGNAGKVEGAGDCRGCVATGRWTKDGQIVMAHNNWTNYRNGERWRIVFDIAAKNGYRMLMDGFPGVIASDDDFGINSDGLMVTETTITQFEGWDPNGKAEFVRARKALQYAGSIDEYTRIMLDGNNGGHANNQKPSDAHTGEIAQLELGLKAHKLWRTKDGVLAGSNWARDPRVLKEDTPKFDPNDQESSPNARRARWEELLKENKGKIDVTLAEKMMRAHGDTAEKKEDANERTLCGHVDGSPRGVKEWGWDPDYPGGG